MPPSAGSNPAAPANLIIMLYINSLYDITGHLWDRFGGNLSGRKQHHIPQSLLRGFGKAKGKKTQVAVYDRDGRTYTAATDGIGAARNFYSPLAADGEGETLDDRITTYETGLAGVLANLRATPFGDRVDPHVAAELVTHLSIRCAHLRSTYEEAASQTVGFISGVFGDVAKTRELIGLNSDAPSSIVTEELDKLWEQFGAALSADGVTKRHFTEILFGHLKANFEEIFAGQLPAFAAAFADMTSQAGAIATRGQTGAMERTLAPEARIEKLSHLEWTMEAAPDEGAVLPDCVAVALTSDGRYQPIMLADLDEVVLTFMPVSHDRLLVGRKANSIPLPIGINGLSASCSWDFFVAPDHLGKLKKLNSTIRTQAGGILSQIMDDAFQSASVAPT